jgi:hypothetical protein
MHMKRRDMLGATAAAMAGLAIAAPHRAAHAHAPKAGSSWSPQLLVWQPDHDVVDYARLRAGWMPRCASVRGNSEDLHSDELREACAHGVEQGLLRVRVLGLANAHAARPVELRAHFAEDAVHGLWSAWQGAAGFMTSAPVAIRWQDEHATGLRLSLNDAVGASAHVVLPAQRGAYALLLDAPLAAARALVFRATREGEPYARVLVERRSGKAFGQPYLLIGVERWA